MPVLKAVAPAMSEAEQTQEEKRNVAYYSSDYAVNVEFDTYGLTPTEKHIVGKYFLQANARVLDIGCGRGRTTAPLSEAGYNVTGVDISPEMIRAARLKFSGLDFLVMDACDLRFEDETFDYVIFSFNGLDVIYPEARRLLALREIHRVLKKNGIFVFSSHNRWWLGLPLPSLSYFLLKVVPLNLFNLRLFRKYRLGRLRSGDMLTMYHIDPFSQRAQLKRLGFKPLETLGEFRKIRPLQYFEAYLHYVARKQP